MGKSDKRALRSHLINLLHHLLKQNFCKHQKGNSNSWDASIDNSRLDILLILKDSPSLKRELSNMLDFSRSCLKKAIKETKMKSSSFPKQCPWSISEIFDD